MSTNYDEDGIGIATLMIMIIMAMMLSMIMMKKTNLEPAMVNIFC